MGLGQTILYIVVPLAVVIYLLASDTTGLNFSLKVNFIANFSSIYYKLFIKQLNET